MSGGRGGTLPPRVSFAVHRLSLNSSRSNRPRSRKNSPGRSLFALDRPWLPLAASVIPVLCNLVMLWSMPPQQPEFIGLGASVGLLCAFAVLFALARARRTRWLAEN